MEVRKIQKIPPGYSEVLYKGNRYGVSRADFNNGKSIKLYAEELGGKDFISLNYYIREIGEGLKPCEMSAKKVRHFLNNFRQL